MSFSIQNAGAMYGTAKMPSQWRFAMALGIASWTLTASAATDITETKQATLPTTAAHILEVLGSSDVCDEGCKYYAPQTVREVKVGHLAEPNSYYKWTHVSGIKTVKFFSHVRIVPGAVTQVSFRSLTKEADAELIRDLEGKTGLVHEPAFDLSTAAFTITPKGDQVEVKVSAMTRISGLIGMFAGAARKGMKDSLNATFGNFTRK
jgi:hypothetical protein